MYDVTRHAWATTWGCHQVTGSCGCSDKAPGTVRQSMGMEWCDGIRVPGPSGATGHSRVDIQGHSRRGLESLQFSPTAVLS